MLLSRFHTFTRSRLVALRRLLQRFHQAEPIKPPRFKTRRKHDDNPKCLLVAFPSPTLQSCPSGRLKNLQLCWRTCETVQRIISKSLIKLTIVVWSRLVSRIFWWILFRKGNAKNWKVTDHFQRLSRELIQHFSEQWILNNWEERIKYAFLR